MIITETEIQELSEMIERSDFFDCVVPFARAVESAILNKLEPICEIIRGKDDIGTMRTAVWKNGILADVGIKLYKLPNPAPSETPSK